MTTLIPHQDFIQRVHNAMTSGTAAKKNGWIYLPEASIYYRVTRHYIGEPAVVRTTIDLANFSITPRFQSQGYFKTLVYAMELFAVRNNLEAVYVESILNPIVERYLRQCGYEEADPAYPTSLFKLVKKDL